MYKNKANAIKYPLQQFEDIHQILIDNFSDPIFYLNSECRFLYVNQAFSKETEISVDQIIGNTISDVLDKEEADKLSFALNHVFQNNEEQVIEGYVSQTDGDKYFENRLIPVSNSQGKVIKVVCFSKDISKLKEAEEKLSESNDRLNKESDQIKKLLAFLRRTDIGGSEITSFVIEECIKITESQLGFFGFIDDAETEMNAHLWSEQAMKSCAIDNKPVKFPLKTAGIWAEPIRTHHPLINNNYQEFDIRKKGYPTGHVPLLRLLSIPIIRGGKVVAILALANKKQDYTDDDFIHLSLFIENIWALFEKKEAEVALIRNEAYYRALIENASDIITILDADDIIQYNSPAIEKVLGYRQSELIHQDVWKFIHIDDLPFVQDALHSLKQKTGLTISLEFRLLDKAGSWRYFEATFSNLLENDTVNGIIVNYHDISERKDAEVLQKEIYRLDQLNTIGQMAAGIGHEIRNPMTTIRGYLQLLQDNQELEAFKSKFELMIDEIDRANSIISDFLSLAQTKPSEMKMCNLNDIITQIFPLIQADTFTKNMEIIFEPGEIPLVPLNIKEIRQLILNLCRNGLEAMKEGGCLTLRTFKDRQHVILSVKDEGSGILSENLDMIGKPFFSTKDNGTGLGLASCYNIATRHNAVIDFDTSPRGTTFFIQFNCENPE